MIDEHDSDRDKPRRIRRDCLGRFIEEDWDEPGIDPDNLAEWEDSDGDQWHASLDGRYIAVRCWDGTDGELKAYMDLDADDIRDFRMFLKKIHDAYRAVPDDVKETIRERGR